MDVDVDVSYVGVYVDVDVDVDVSCDDVHVDVDVDVSYTRCIGVMAIATYAASPASLISSSMACTDVRMVCRCAAFMV